MQNTSQATVLGVGLGTRGAMNKSGFEMWFKRGSGVATCNNNNNNNSPTGLMPFVSAVADPRRFLGG